MKPLLDAAEKWGEENPGYFYLGHTHRDGMIALLFEYPESHIESQIRLYEESEVWREEASSPSEKAVDGPGLTQDRLFSKTEGVA